MLQDSDVICVGRRQIGVGVFVRKHGSDFGFIQRQGLARPGEVVSFDFGPELTDACYNLAYSILWACCPLDAGYWYRWFAQTVLATQTRDRWEIPVGEVRGLIECGEEWFARRSRPGHRGALEVTSCTVGGGTLTTDDV